MTSNLDPSGQATERRETYVPMHTTDLVEFLAQHPALADEEVAEFRNLASLILALLHHVYRQRHEQLTYLYAPLDPDRDTLLLSVPISDQRERAFAELFQRLDDVLSRANYRRLHTHEIELAMNAASHWGVRMRVDYDKLQRIEVYARGNSIGQKPFRHWKRLFRQQMSDVRMYQRLVVIFRTEASDDSRFDSRRLYLRMFKNIPQDDVEMVMPAARLRMTLWDHSSIVLPTLYTIVSTGWKMLRYVVLLTLIGCSKQPRQSCCLHWRYCTVSSRCLRIRSTRDDVTT